MLIFGGGFLAQIMSQLLFDKKCHIFVLIGMNIKRYFFRKIFFTTKESDLEESSFDFGWVLGAKDVISKCIKYAKLKLKFCRWLILLIILNADGISSLMKRTTNYRYWNSKYRPDLKQKCDWHETISLLSSEKLLINLISHIVNNMMLSVIKQYLP